MIGNLFIISAPSGAGKTSLVNALLKDELDIALSISYTTRAPRPGEVNGQDYHFIDQEHFLKMAAQGDFLESAEVYGNFYGTSQSWIKDQISAGRNILLEIDWQGAAQVRKLIPQAITIFILPPSLSALQTRLQGRGQDSEQIIEQRLQAVREDISHVVEFDYVIINDKLEEALQQLQAIVMAAQLRAPAQLTRHIQLLEQLQN